MYSVLSRCYIIYHIRSCRCALVNDLYDLSLLLSRPKYRTKNNPPFRVMHTAIRATPSVPSQSARTSGHRGLSAAGSGAAVRLICRVPVVARSAAVSSGPTRRRRDCGGTPACGAAAPPSAPSAPPPRPRPWGTPSRAPAAAGSSTSPCRAGRWPERGGPGHTDTRRLSQSTTQTLHNLPPNRPARPQRVQRKPAP